MQILFDFPKQQIAIEGEELELVELLKLVRDIAPKFPAINIVANTTESEPEKRQNEKPVSGNGTTMRQFCRSLDLQNISERIAAIAYYQKEHASNPGMSPKAMSGYFIQCGFQQPAQMPVAMFDAKRKYGYMESAGHGLWRVSTEGQNLIVGKMEARTEISEE